ncbi:hypothetical protein [Candidatus Scalindua japonica]|uniref:hypothetical protein n=1 Tax=Candidatus Scalindua japonica TaxID=1284222 RepID=UPI001056B178|nr:hypothetical protein [Candidatus Scalindua japonica]
MQQLNNGYGNLLTIPIVNSDHKMATPYRISPASTFRNALLENMGDTGIPSSSYSSAQAHTL